MKAAFLNKPKQIELKQIEIPEPKHGEVRVNICINKRVIGVNEVGCFAEYICLPSEFCWQVPDTISDADAVTIEPTAVSVHALLASKAKPGDTIAVIGLGAIGLLLTHLALYSDASFK